jgi:hypothetical protein
LADEFCTSEFEEFVGLAYDESELWLSYLYPNNEGWTWEDDRQIRDALPQLLVVRNGWPFCLLPW